MIPTPQELKRGKLTKKNLEQAVALLGEEGYLVLQGLVPKTLLKEIRQAMVPVHRQFFEKGPGPLERPHAFGKGHGIFGVRPPREMPFMDPQVVANPVVLQIIEQVLGPDFIWDFYNTNNSWPGSRVQHVHRDLDPLFDNLPHPLPAAAMVLSIPLVAFTARSGATEIWPGTHLFPGPYSGPDRSFDAVAPDRPSRRMLSPLGGVVLRDPRMWHRGMPNRTGKVRTMLTLIYRREFYASARAMGIRREVWEQLPERARHMLRFSSVD